MEVNLLIRIQNLQELKDWIALMELFPNIGKGIDTKRIVELTRDIDELQKKRDELAKQVGPPIAPSAAEAPST